MKKIFVAAMVFLLAVPTFADAVGVNLSWKDNATNEDGYIIEKKIGTAATAVFVEIKRTTANAITFVDNANPGETVTYRVKAFNVSGVSIPSNEASVTIPTLPASPTGLTVITVSIGTPAAQ